VEITAVNGIAQTYIKKYSVDRVYASEDGKKKVDQTVYTVTVYDSNGILTTVTNSHKINYVV
tara:strand:- start:3893 stop:4078 length:186 start_codon:yes stop_codon:yes gene_type:complete